MRRTLASLLAAGALLAASVAVTGAALADEPPVPPGPHWVEEADGAPFGFHAGYQNGMRAGFMLYGFWEDGVLDSEELAQLPEGHPLLDAEGPAAAFLSDGVLTAEEHEQLRALHQELYAERHAERQAYRELRRAQAEARWELREQYRAECEELGDDCPIGPIGPAFGGRGWGRQGPNV